MIDTKPGVLADAATVLIPGHSLMEKQGSVTNLEGRVQRIRAALPPATSVPSELRVLSMLAVMPWPTASNSATWVMSVLTA